MRLLDAETAHHGRDIRDRELPTVTVLGTRHLARRIAARIVGDAAITAREVADPRLPFARVRAEFVHKHDRISAARLLDVETRSFGLDERHRLLPCSCREVARVGHGWEAYHSSPVAEALGKRECTRAVARVTTDRRPARG